MIRAAALLVALALVALGLRVERYRRPAAHRYDYRRASVATTWARRFTVHINRTINPREVTA